MVACVCEYISLHVCVFICNCVSEWVRVQDINSLVLDTKDKKNVLCSGQELQVSLKMTQKFMQIFFLKSVIR